MYRLAEIIENDGSPSIVGEVSFHPSGSYFAATYENINEVRVYDARNRKLLQVLSKPQCQLDGPHGVLFTENYLLVSNKHCLKGPGMINVYRNSGTITEPIQVFQTPFDHLREPHSLALRDGRLVVTYCENQAPHGAVVCYGFNEDSGKITGPVDKTKSWFADYGDSKGICFNTDGTKILVTFESDKKLSALEKIVRKSIKSIRKLRKRFIAEGLGIGRSLGMITTANTRAKIPKSTKNGIAIFPISSEGKIALSPDQIIVREKFCALENIDIFDGTCVVTDVINHSFSLYDLTQDQRFTKPVQTVDLGNVVPHGAKFSPDGRLLVISCLGLKIVNQEIQFYEWQAPRGDKLLIFERAI